MSILQISIPTTPGQSAVVGSVATQPSTPTDASTQTGHGQGLKREYAVVFYPAPAMHEPGVPLGGMFESYFLFLSSRRWLKPCFRQLGQGDRS
jgi:hypothetical protein